MPGGYTEPPPEITRAPGPASGFGASVLLGGGVMNFSGDAARALSDVGGSWDLRLGWGSRSILGIEAAYIGTANSLNATGLDNNAVLLGSGAEGLIRLNAPLVYRDALFEPFGFAGLGWTRFDVVNEDFNVSAISDKDHVMTLPIGGGIAAVYRSLMVDARFTYRFTYEEDLIGNTDLGNWIVSANIGSEF
jgi:hypothetical protein